MRRPIPLALLVLVLATLPARAGSLAVFVDGRILEVEDARIQDGRIRLVLPGGGALEVPATRIDRVILDATPDREDPPPGTDPACDPSWSDEPLPGALPFAPLIMEAARAENLHPWLLASLVQQESGFDPRAESRAGARGLTQLMPAAAADHGVTDVWDPAENLRGGARHLRRLLDRFRDLRLALAAYNAGAATVERSGGVPPYRETRTFVRLVLRHFCGAEGFPPAPAGGPGSRERPPK